jgi:tight adherence protein B
MSTVLLIACAGMITGFFILIGLKPLEFTDGIFKLLLGKPKSLKDEIKESTKQRKVSYLRSEVAQAQNVLALTGRSKKFPMVCAMSLLFFTGGASVAIMLNNFFLVPVLAAGCMLLPFWYVKLMEHNYKKDVSAELETALSIITSAYLRSEDLLTAVEENLSHLNPPVKTVFADFLTRVRLIDPDTEAAIEIMSARIDNEVFREWCGAMAACLRDRSLKTTLTPIVGKLSDMRMVNAELDYLVFEPRKEFITMILLVLGNIPLMYLLNKSWYDTMMHTAYGKVILAITAAVIFISTARVLKLTKPIEYKR